jgi:chloramphenicol 3-O-phosphotransferase
MTAALVITGAPGTGKSSVLQALANLLEVEHVPFGALESEQLAWGSPWLPHAAWLLVLARVIDLQREAGRELFLVAATTETADELRDVLEALAAVRVLVVCLKAAPDTVAARIAQREPDAWPGKQTLIAHARELAESIPSIEGLDAIVDTDDRDPVDVAREIRDALGRLL